MPSHIHPISPQALLSLFLAVANCGRTSITVSEEEEKPMAIEAVLGGAYIACFDPIDG